MADMINKLQALKLEVGSIESKTETGALWSQRMKRSEKNYKEYSGDWEELRKLLVDTYNNWSNWGSAVAMGWAVIKNMGADLYYKNPDIYVQSRANDPDRVKERILRDLFNTIHDDCQSGMVMKRCIFTTSWAGFGIAWHRFEQEGYLTSADDGAEETTDETAPPSTEEADGGEVSMAAQAFHATDQRICSEFVDPREFRVDPDGRQWDFSDHKFVARLYTRTLQELWEDQSIPKESREMLVSWYPSQPSRRRSAPDAETDPAYLDVRIWEIWSKVEKKIIHLPADGAQFDLGVFPWPRALSDADTYPCDMVAFNRNVDDENGVGGWAPIPELRLIRCQLENLNRLEGLFLESATNALNIYLTLEGLIPPDKWSKMLSKDSNRKIIGIDPQTLIEKLGLGALPPDIDLRRLLALLPQNDDQAKAIGWAQMIDHELNVIYQVMGQGPGDRGGISEAGSATEAANIRAQLDKRTNDRVEEVEATFLRSTNIIWQLIRRNQTLPLAYRSASGAGEGVWAEIAADDIADLELFFKVAAGSSRPRNRAQVKVDRSELAAKIAPFLAQPLTEELVAFLIYVIEPYEESEDLVEMLRSRLKAQTIAADLAQLDLAIAQGQINGADPAVAVKKQELISQLNAAVLGPGGIHKVAMAEQPQQGPPPGTPNVSAGRSAGQIAAAEAAAGSTNIQ